MDAKARGRIAALERLVTILIKEYARNPQQRGRVLNDLNMEISFDPPWLKNKEGEKDEQASLEYRLAIADWQKKLS